MTLLSVRGLDVSFVSGKSVIRAVNGLDLDLDEGSSLAIVGESGSGKSVLASAILGMLEDNGTARGEMLFDGEDLMKAERRRMVALRGKDICLLPQNAWSAWDPIMRIGDQMIEFLRKCGVPKEEAPQIAEGYLGRCGLDPSVLRSYAHRLSGGMSQRAMIAMCTAVHPRLLIADEPTKGLDGRSRKLVLDVISTVRERSALLMITHDLKAARSCEDVAIMYGGRIVEIGPANDVLDHPRHPYTKGLCAAHPNKGMVPIPGCIGERTSGEGCCFRDRCCSNDAACSGDIPLDGNGWKVRCCHADR
ncbi:MAG: ABC transporter ATP-binding protein [Methanomassiliicoccales archaeon]|nr:ABC transporter ATP-binding protein [Methanomassiliicoccales archaeon]